MNSGAMSGVGRRLTSHHRQLASNLTDGSVPDSLLPSGRAIKVAVEGLSLPISQRVLGTLQRPATNREMPADMSTAGGLSSIAVLGSNRRKGRNPLFLEHTFGTLSGPTAGFSTLTNSGGRTVVPQTKQTFSTSAGDPSVTNAGYGDGG